MVGEYRTYTAYIVTSLISKFNKKKLPGQDSNLQPIPLTAGTLLHKKSSPGRTRTCNLLVNSQTLLPIELPGSGLSHLTGGRTCNLSRLRRERYCRLSYRGVEFTFLNQKERLNKRAFQLTFINRIEGKINNKFRLMSRVTGAIQGQAS